MKNKVMSMNEDLKIYPVFRLENGKLKQIHTIKTTDDYNHSVLALHHYILRKKYVKNKDWYMQRGVYQKLILMPIPLHEQVHNWAIKNLSDEDFERTYGISRWELFFNERHSEY